MWVGRSMIILSFPLAFLLIMFTGGHHAPMVAARVLIWMWVAALSAGIVCVEAVWRNRLRLERIMGERLPGFRV